jgi:hypothetical protein
MSRGHAPASGKFQRAQPSKAVQDARDDRIEAWNRMRTLQRQRSLSVQAATEAFIANVNTGHWKP